MYNTEFPNRAELPSSRQLMRSTFLAALTAAVLLLTARDPLRRQTKAPAAEQVRANTAVR